jgi:hypothetical protein
MLSSLVEGLGTGGASGAIEEGRGGLLWWLME